MGWDATYYFEKGTKRNDVERFLVLLGYRKTESDSFIRSIRGAAYYFPSEGDPARLSGVTSIVSVDESGILTASSRTNIWASSRDTELQNMTLRELRRFFKGHFVSDLGRNRYFRNSGPKRRGIEAACFVAACKFLNSVVALHVLAGWSVQKSDPPPRHQRDYPWINQANPAVLGANLSVVFLVSLLEEFFKTVFIEAIRASASSVNLNSFGTIGRNAVKRMLENGTGPAEAIAETLSFQNGEQIRSNFRNLPSVSHIDKYLGKNTSRRSIGKRVERLQAIFTRRHTIIHSAQLDYNFIPDDLKREVDFCEKLILGLYRHLAVENGWPYERPS